jgi:hypothetical protein
VLLTYFRAKYQYYPESTNITLKVSVIVMKGKGGIIGFSPTRIEA